MKQKTMIEAFQSINKRRQSEEMPITTLAMFSEAWDYKQAEIDALKSVITKQEITMLQIQQSCSGCDSRDLLIDELQKRIVELDEAYHKGIFNKPLVIVDTINILKGDKMTEKELFLYELNGHGYEFKNTTFTNDRFEDDSLNMAWEMWQASAKREGFVLVPKEPTKEMLDAALYRQWDEVSSPMDNMDVLKYKAMLSAVEVQNGLD